MVSCLRFTLRTYPSAAALALLLAAATAHAQFPRSTVDPAQATHGAEIYAKDCAGCHGDNARGEGIVPDLLRSTMVLHDRREMLMGKELAPYLKNESPHHFNYNDKDAAALSQFLTQSINKILRSGYDDRPKELTSGDAKAGEAYFNGAGGCSKCHSVTGDLAGVGKKYTAAALQQKFLFPASGIGSKRKQQVTVVVAGKTYTGDLVRIDDFTVAIKNKAGDTVSFNRTPATRVTMVDPYTAHVELLDKYTDADIHNLTTYLDTLQ
jgi:mono/diheme cytochrome c family protein